MKALKLVVILAIVLMSFSVRAICPVQKTSIFYINGADNEEQDTIDSTDRLHQALKRKTNPECITVSYAYNQTQEGITDILEAFRQESLEEILTPTNFWEMFERLVPARPAFSNLMSAAVLANPINLLDTEILRQINKHLVKYRLEPVGNQLLFVGHSAGNYFANEERLAMTETERNRTKIVSVATLANNVAGASGPYTTVFEDRYVSSFAGALVPNLNNVGECTDDWACHGWLSSYMVPGSNSRTQIVNDIIAALPTTPVTPSGVQYLRLAIGNPGIPGDGVFVTATSSVVFSPEPPFSLQGITNGITVSVFPPISTPLQNLFVQVQFTAQNTPTCSGITGGVSFVSTPLVNGVGGRAAVISQSLLNSLVAFIRTQPDCGTVSLADFSVGQVSVFNLTSNGTVALSQLDAIAVGIGENVFPTNLTPAP